MKLSEDYQELILGNSNIHLEPSCVVKLKEEFTIHTKDGEIILEVDVTADLIKIPEEYREIFINMLTTKYLNRVTFVDSIFTKHNSYVELTWWQKLKNIITR